MCVCASEDKAPIFFIIVIIYILWAAPYAADTGQRRRRDYTLSVPIRVITPTTRLHRARLPVYKVRNVVADRPSIGHPTNRLQPDRLAVVSELLVVSCMCMCMESR